MTTKAIDQLLKEKQKFEALFNFATVGIVIANSRGEITLVNQHAETIFGYETDELRGKKVEVLIPMDRQHPHQANREHYTVHPQVRQMGYGRDLKARRKDGSELPVEISLSYFHTDEGLFVIAFILDITVRKQNEAILLQQKAELETITREIKVLNSNLEEEVERRTETLRQTLNQLESSRKELQDALKREKQLGELKSRFVTMASHEFKTPLATILTSTTLIGKYQKSEDQIHREKHLKRISDTVLNLSNLLNEFLSIGKLEEGKIKPKPELFFLPDHMKEIVSEMQSQAGEGKQILIEMPEVGDVELDKELIRYVMLNLLSNAIKFSPPASTITVKAFRKNDALNIEVQDQGIGISRKDQEHLFERFFRGRNADNIQGTGLGLHIVQRYLKLMEGEIKIQSELNKGTIISLLFENK
ncbi:MAG TPA: PAS domain-containing sensor histidine kinase [Catalimonadaceae bacterium]|nr:PAS domain-containing sensor histidine kinase [Catalimonadaceae bacterium]